MVTVTKIVIGTVNDGQNSATAAATTLAKKINDIATAATTIHSVTIAKWGARGVAVIVYTA